MIKIRSEAICRIASSLAPSELINSDFVIAGGFSTLLLRLYSSYSEEVLMQNFVNEYKSDVQFKLLTYQFGDIDMWITKDNPLAKNELFLSDKIYPFETGRNLYHRVTKFLFGESYWQRNMLAERIKKDFGFRAHPVHVTLMAYSCEMNSDSGLMSVQFIRNAADSIESLLDSFDFEHNKVAFYQGHLYFKESTLNSILSNTIEVSESFKGREERFMYCSANRAFKYHKRNGYKFSQELSDEIYKLYVKISMEEPIDNFKLNPSQEVSSYPGDFKIGSAEREEVLRTYKLTLLSKFKTFIQMPTFQEDYIPLLIGSPYPQISSVIEEYIK